MIETFPPKSLPVSYPNHIIIINTAIQTKNTTNSTHDKNVVQDTTKYMANKNVTRNNSQNTSKTKKYRSHNPVEVYY